jgi:hypothetical protein
MSARFSFLAMFPFILIVHSPTALANWQGGGEAASSISVTCGGGCCTARNNSDRRVNISYNYYNGPLLTTVSPTLSRGETHQWCNWLYSYGYAKFIDPPPAPPESKTKKEVAPPPTPTVMPSGWSENPPVGYYPNDRLCRCAISSGGGAKGKGDLRVVNKCPTPLEILAVRDNAPSGSVGGPRCPISKAAGREFSLTVLQPGETIVGVGVAAMTEMACPGGFELPVPFPRFGLNGARCD